MTLNEYQQLAGRTALYPTIGHPLVYPTMGLVGEAGEISEKVKKLFRDRNGVIDEEWKLMLTKELVDVLWYVSRVAAEAGLELEAVGQMNIDKLRSRRDRGTLHGDGDNR